MVKSFGNYAAKYKLIGRQSLIMFNTNLTLICLVTVCVWLSLTHSQTRTLPLNPRLSCLCLEWDNVIFHACEIVHTEHKENLSRTHAPCMLFGRIRLKCVGNRVQIFTVNKYPNRYQSIDNRIDLDRFALGHLLYHKAFCSIVEKYLR